MHNHTIRVAIASRQRIAVLVRSTKAVAAAGRDHEEDISFHPKDGICDFAVHDEGDPKGGSRTPIEIVMEHVFGVSPEDLVVRERTPEFEQAVDWLSERVFGAALSKRDAKWNAENVSRV